nr:zinc finger, CCHC-type [Tanacetum cinerariifolium]
MITGMESHQGKTISSKRLSNVGLIYLSARRKNAIFMKIKKIDQLHLLGRLAEMGRKSSSDDYGDGITPGKNNQFRKVIKCGSDLSFCKEEKSPLHENQENRSTALAERCEEVLKTGVLALGVYILKTDVLPLGFVGIVAAVVWWCCCGDVDAVVLLWWLSVESLPKDTDVVPFTYNLNGNDIRFGKEEFCLVVALRFGVDFSSRYLAGRIPFRRRVFIGDFSVINYFRKAEVKGAAPPCGVKGQSPLLGPAAMLAGRGRRGITSRGVSAMAEEDAFLVDDVEGGLCVDNTDAGIDGRCNSGSNNDKGKGGKNKNNKQNKGKKRGFKVNNGGFGSNKKPKLECWKCGKTSHFKRDGRSGNKKNNASASGSGKGLMQFAWWIDSGAITLVCKDRCWFKTYEPVEDESVLYMGNDHFAPVHGKGSMVLEFSSGKSITLFNVLYVPKLRIIHETTAPYIPQQNGVAERKNRALKEMVISMLSYSGLSDGFWGEAMLTACYLLNMVHNKRNKTTPYELWFYVIEPNESVSINTIIESRDVIFDKNRFSSIPKPKDIIPNSNESQRDDHSNDVPSETPEPRKGKRVRKAKSYAFDFQLYLVEGSRDQIGSQYSYCYSIKEDPKTYNEAMQSRDSCKPLACKWIFKRKIKVDGTIDKFKARLVIQGFRKKERIDYFDTYALVARITTIRLLLALAAIHNLVIHQLDVKTTFLNGDLEEEVYMKQHEGFVMPGNEHKLCKLVKSLYGLKQALKQWHQKFDEAVLFNGFLLNQSDKCVYSKFDGSGKGVIICLYVDDMLIFGTGQNQVDKNKKFLSSKFSMKDMGEADVILGIKIKSENKGIKSLCQIQHVDQLEYSRVIGCLMYAMTSTRPDIAYAVGRLSRFTSNHSKHHWDAITRVFKYLKGEVPFHTCITSSTMESEFVTLDAAGKEAEWLRNLIHETLIWPKPVAPISIHCDSDVTLSKAYSQIYNGKSRHLGVRHSMIRELIMNGVIFIEFVLSQHNLADHLRKALAKDLVIKGQGGRAPLRGQGAEPLAGVPLPDMDGNHITGGMLLDKIDSVEFDTMNHEDTVIEKHGTCIIGVRTYGQLYQQLRDANVTRWDSFYAAQRVPGSPLPKYSLSGFTWVFKGARPNARPRPDAFEAKAELWVSSRAFFDSRIREPPQISSPINQHSRYHIPEDIYRHMWEQDRSLKETQSKVATHVVLLNKILQ